MNPYANTRPIVSPTSPTRRLIPKEIEEHKANDLYFTCYKPGYGSRDPYDIKGNYTGSALLKTLDLDEDCQDAPKEQRDKEDIEFEYEEYDPEN